MDTSAPKPQTVKPTWRNIPFWKFFLRILFAGLFLGLISIFAMVIIVSVSPITGAHSADILRKLLGPKPIANMEAIVFTIQDAAHRVLFDVDPIPPEAPWAVSAIGSTNQPTSQISTPFTQDIPGSPLPPSTQVPLQAEAEPIGTPMNTMESTAVETALSTLQPSIPDPAPTKIATAEVWLPANLPPLGETTEEGIWQPYIVDETGSVLAYKTFLEPDPKRSYVFAGIVAFDLSHTQLHYQLGTLEPETTLTVPRSGEIPDSNRQPGSLLAAFNGGFKTINGHFGVFMDGEVLVPPINGMGTIVIYQDGSVQIGEWGTDFSGAEGITTYRQNCPLMVHNGEINPLVFNNSVNDWGGTFSGNIVTFRSGIGISQDRNTLYYVAGNNLSMPLLAQALQVAGAFQAMQLDINSYYVLFTRFLFQEDAWIAEPLLPKEMVDNVGRFLAPYSHDFFYLTSTPP